ncbi:SDR family oxidoreductase, partial [Acidimicrobiaceae bacterium]|nr:SDR family oxidoreductase [Acidimicrobiaceae bacterium]
MKIAVVTGASRGIGHFLSEKLSKENYRVVNISRKSSDAFIDYSFDLTNTQDIGKLVKQIIKEVGIPDLLINNAGVASMNHTFLMKDSDVEKIVDVNFISPILLSKEFGKFMIKKGGKILNISTVAVPLLLDGEAVYAATKSGIEVFTKILAKELSRSKVDVSCIGLTPIDTDLIKNVPKDKIDKIT